MLTQIFQFGTILLTLSMAAVAYGFQESEEIETPTLEAIAPLLPEDATDLSQLEAIGPDGRSLSNRLLMDIKDRLDVESFQYPDHVTERPENLQPLIFVFSVDTRLEESGAVPYLTIGQKEIPARSWNFGPNDGMLTALILPPPELTEWPETCKVRIQYADKNPETLREYTGPFTERIDMGEGCYCEPTHQAPLRLKFARPFESSEQPAAFQKRYIEAVVHLHDGSLLKTGTIMGILWSDAEGKTQHLVTTYDNCSIGEIEKVELLEKTFAWKDLGKIHLKAKQ